MKILWTEEAWNDYLYWHQQNQYSVIKKINRLIKDIKQEPFEGIGKPEPLKYNLSSKWSRKITSEHRMIYKYVDDTLFIYSVKEHY
ncbi:Txe/YoeB family addiction module toxin [Companilactobacillus mishanensis]|uniref:Endoribonuclease YoeB n=1 Tax=Companilactobacillus mishanensis TaxID=2486008 RepID=A0A5P0ZHZ2_9LACO|nr:Txe/YoeB family addiction module toxin [Companilactobacillus mishanensis]MQS45128.1 Txe/YoeB family addiction module toxin [Companilactobacillus mishanensis]MQS52618.1 Txe/YoeB family addiction module toxin [Companilactobacillus mishanensis]MQS90190.1 Txe/YoeB family addiction module toxin [Companilactobacillus mishanensis]